MRQIHVWETLFQGYLHNTKSHCDSFGHIQCSSSGGELTLDIFCLLQGTSLLKGRGWNRQLSKLLLYVAAVSAQPAKSASERFYSKLLDEQTPVLFFFPPAPGVLTRTAGSCGCGPRKSLGLKKINPHLLGCWTSGKGMAIGFKTENVSWKQANLLKQENQSLVCIPSTVFTFRRCLYGGLC